MWENRNSCKMIIQRSLWISRRSYGFFFKDVRVPSGLCGKYQIPTIPTNWVDNTNKTKKAWDGHRESKLYNAGLAFKVANTLTGLTNTSTGLTIVMAYTNTELASLTTIADGSVT